MSRIFYENGLHFFLVLQINLFLAPLFFLVLMYVFPTNRSIFLSHLSPHICSPASFETGGHCLCGTACVGRSPQIQTVIQSLSVSIPITFSNQQILAPVPSAFFFFLLVSFWNLNLMNSGTEKLCVTFHFWMGHLMYTLLVLSFINYPISFSKTCWKYQSLCLFNKLVPSFQWEKKKHWTPPSAKPNT